MDEATLAVAVLTLVVLGVQTGVFGLQAKQLRETIEAMKVIDGAQDMRNEEALRVSAAAAQASAESAALTKRTLVLAQRPRIRVGNVWLGNGDKERPAFHRHGTIAGMNRAGFPGGS